MQFLDLSFPTPEQNLACDEALLDARERGLCRDMLRFWEPAEYFVVLGLASRLYREVNIVACRNQGVKILRRCSGGGTVLQGPGCLNYSLILHTEDSVPLRHITSTNRFIMDRQRRAVSHLFCEPVRVQGATDLTVGNLKFSGNAQRRKKHSVLFHGTFLLDFQLDWMDRLLPMPPKQPAYRQERSHAAFLTNLKHTSERVKHALRTSWDATDQAPWIPSNMIERLARGKYADARWIHRC